MAVHVTRAGVVLTVGIIVLTGLIVGGLFWAKHSGEGARRNEAIALAEQNLKEDSRKEVVLNDGATQKNDNQQGTERPSSAQSSENDSTVGELPQTGLADGFGTVIAIGVITFTSVSYLRSRRALLG